MKKGERGKKKERKKGNEDEGMKTEEGKAWGRDEKVGKE